MEPAPVSAPVSARVGHVHLRVSDLDRSVCFYADVLGLSVTARSGEAAAFLSWDGYHHHVALNVWGSRGGTPPPPGHTGLFHAAFLYPDRPALARAVRRVRDRGVRLTGASDHGVSEAVYLEDPDGNGIELYRDRPPEEWPRGADGSLGMGTARLDLERLLAEA